MSDRQPGRPIRASALEEIFAPVALVLAAAPRPHRICIAVSGGADSMAMMLLAARWAEALSPDVRPLLDVATVDHGLRPASGDEARGVAAAADALGLVHHTLAWVGTKPATGLQEAAREARMSLLLAHARATGAQAVLLAHTIEDQAETVLMRLARGTGVDGLGAMAPVVACDGVAVVRPMLTTRRADLVATLAAEGLEWIDDPSNCDLRFERVCMRAEAAALARLGLEPAMLALTAKRSRRAASALDQIAARVISDRTFVSFPEIAGRHVGIARVDWHRLNAEPQDIVLRVLVRLIDAIGGTRDRGLVGKVETILEDGRAPPSRTLARVRLHPRRRGMLDIVREARRVCLPRETLEPGQRVAWDDRFMVGLASEAVAPIEVVALSEASGMAGAPALDLPPEFREALATVPAFVQDDRIVAVPNLGFGPPGPWACSWMGLERLVPVPMQPAVSPRSPHSRR